MQPANFGKINEGQVLARSRPSNLVIAYLKAALGALHSARVGTPCPHGNPKNVGQLVAHD